MSLACSLNEAEDYRVIIAFMNSLSWAAHFVTQLNKTLKIGERAFLLLLLKPGIGFPRNWIEESSEGFMSSRPNDRDKLEQELDKSL